MNERERLLRRTAIHQDTINGVTDPGPWPTGFWAERDEDLWTAGIATDSGMDESGVWHEPGDVVVRHWRTMGDSDRLAGGSVLAPAPGTGLADQVMEDIGRWNNGLTPARHGTVDTPGRMRLTIPGAGEGPAMGWAEAMEQAAGESARAHPETYRRALIGNAVRTAGRPCTWFLEDNGYDLILIEWRVDQASGNHTGYDLRHMQYDDATLRLRTIAHGDAIAPITPRRMDDTGMLTEGRIIYDGYQHLRNHDGGPETAATPHPVAASGIAHGDAGPLPPDGEEAEWNRLVEREAIRRLAGTGTPRARATAMPDGAGPAIEPGAGEGMGPSWPGMWIANGDVHPYTLHARDGRDWEKMIVTLPAGTIVDGRDYGGWSLDRFMSPANRRQKDEGRDVGIRLRPGQAVELFQRRGGHRRNAMIGEPQALCDAIRTARDATRGRSRPGDETAPGANGGGTILDEGQRGELARLGGTAGGRESLKALELAQAVVESSWDKVERVRGQLSRHMDEGTYDPRLALKAVKRVVDRGSVAAARDQGDTAAKCVGDTGYSARDRRNAALILLSRLLPDESTDTLLPIQTRTTDGGNATPATTSIEGNAGSGARETARETQLAPEPEQPAPRRRGDRIGLLERLRDTRNGVDAPARPARDHDPRGARQARG